MKAGGASKQQEVEVAWQEDERRRQHIMRTRGKGQEGGGAKRGNAATIQGKLEVNERRTPKGLASKDNNDKAPQTGRTFSTNAVEPCLKLLNEMAGAIREMEGSSNKRGGARELLPPTTGPCPQRAEESWLKI